MTDILGLDGWKALQTKPDEFDMAITAEFIKEPDCCVRCGVENPKLKKHGVEDQFFVDTPAHGKRVIIKVKRQRFMCLECGGTFQQVLEGMDEKRHMTRRLVEHIQRQSMLQTFTQVAVQVGLNEKTVRNVFLDYVRGMDDCYDPRTPEWLGIDELKLAGKQRCMLCNVAENSILDILKDRNQPTVEAWLSKLQEPERVAVVTMDMWRPYRNAALKVLPNAICIVDHFHVVRMANDSLNKVRKALRAGLDLNGRRRLMRRRSLILKRRERLDDKQFQAMVEWTDNEPALFSAYQAKEDFFDIYKCQSKAEAMEVYDIWKASLDPDTAATFHEVIRAVDNWRPEIFNYFEVPVTNAYTEAANGMTKITHRIGRGYSFEAIRARMLYSGEAKQIFKARAFSGVCELFRGTLQTYGVSMPQVVELFSSVH